ncbi:MAG: hypothetical protein FJ118_13110, partial [Deltaproteobacteria bacterium]|nr:hypothetical protein [Deltaproteobacteria bacterium]
MDKPVHVLIVTAARGEDEAVREVEDGGLGEWKETDDPEEYGFKIWFRDYETQRGSRRVALTSALEMGPGPAGNAAARLVDLYKPQCLAMCGVCAGNPERTRLGDVIIADPVYDYDKGEEVQTESGTVLRPNITTYQLNARWIDAAKLFSRPKNLPWSTENAPWLLQRPRPLELQGLWLLRELVEGRDPINSSERETICRDWTLAIGYLEEKKFVVYKKGNPVATVEGKSHIAQILFSHAGRLPEQDPWAIRVGPMATGTRLVRDKGIWDRLKATQMRICGLDMEAAAIGLTGFLQDVPMIVVKGVMDHAEPDRNDIFRPFAARAAAEVLIGFLRQHLEPQGDKPTGSRRKQVEAERGKSPKDILSDNIFQTLSSASNPAA